MDGGSRPRLRLNPFFFPTTLFKFVRSARAPSLHISADLHPSSVTVRVPVRVPVRDEGELARGHLRVVAMCIRMYVSMCVCACVC